jgi:hypothetical protein
MIFNFIGFVLFVNRFDLGQLLFHLPLLDSEIIFLEEVVGLNSELRNW